MATQPTDAQRIQSLLERTFYPTSAVNAKHRTIIARYAEPLARLMPEYGIDTPLRQAHFIAQLAHESNELRDTEENLKYSSSRLMEIFPRYFRTPADARAAAYNPVLIADTVYANRLGNGAPATHDGYTFRGRGLIQLTGRDNYKSLADHLASLPASAGLDPDVRFALTDTDRAAALAPLLSQPDIAVRSACFFWQRNRINDVADKGATAAVVASVTRKVNGGTHGLSNRQIYFFRVNILLRQM